MLKNLIQRVNTIFTGPLVETGEGQPEEIRRKWLLNLFVYVLGAYAFIALFFFIYYKVRGSQDPGLIYAIFSIVITIIGLVIIYFVNRRNSFVASTVFIFFMNLAILFSDKVEEVVEGRSFFFLVIPIMLASLMLTSWASFASLGFTAVMIIGMSLNANIDLNFIGLTGLFIVAFVAWAGAGSLEAALSDLRKTLADLRNTNINLEQIVEERTQEVHDAYERLKELEKMKSQFVRSITHELRTPVTNIGMYLTMFKSGDTSKKDMYFSIVEEENKKLEGLVKDVLNLTSLEDESNLEFDWVDLDLLCQELVKNNKLQAEAKGLNFTYFPVHELKHVWGNEQQLLLAFSNLVSNSIKFTNGGMVQITLSKDKQDDYMRFEVQDTGLGISPNDQQHLFERFFRGENALNLEIPGTGLGLAIVKEIVDAHKGRIEVRSELYRGSQFIIFLPTKKETSSLLPEEEALIPESNPNL